MLIFWDVEPQSVTEVLIDSTSSGTSSPAIVMIELRYAISRINWVGPKEDVDSDESSTADSTSTNLLYQPVETFVYKTDMASFSLNFSRRLSAEQTINNVLMESRTGAGVSPEYRLPLIRCITNTISAYMSGGISSDVLKIHFVFDLCEERHMVRNFDEGGEEALLRKIVESFAGEKESFYDVDLMEYLVTEDQEVMCGGVEYATSEKKLDCSICLDELVVGMEVERCPCGHRFHGDCIARWLQRKDSCPLCRRKVQDWIV
ncbi:hypothetical protein J5N97_015096 [Dioscorea zingiberensis]|uniref:RING-type domain-containing protein n=1 Tax=Dioscorea zingiberensis TaxID=325984 RepID=A0A9D5HKP3_9LILI|nr:hypothetical protein J5N97_015096 [Dioscorea zingiberensis]